MQPVFVKIRIEIGKTAIVGPFSQGSILLPNNTLSHQSN